MLKALLLSSAAEALPRILERSKGKTKVALALMTLAFAATATAQNLVPNPNFEDTSSCDAFHQGGEYEPMLGLARPWFSPNMATPDVYTSDPGIACGIDVDQEGLMSPADGLRYVGLFMFTNTPGAGGTKEYAAIRLQEELTAGQEYYLTVRMARATFSRYAVASFGAHFSTDSIHVPSGAKLPVAPQVIFSANGHFEAMEWTTVSGSFTAVGGERFLYIGSFKEDAEMDCLYDPFFGGEDLGYYNIDQVELLPAGVGMVGMIRDSRPAFIHNDVLYWEGGRAVTISLVDRTGKLLMGPVRADGGTYLLPNGVAQGLYLVVVQNEGLQVLKWVRE